MPQAPSTGDHPIPNPLHAPWSETLLFWFTDQNPPASRTRTNPAAPAPWRGEPWEGRPPPGKRSPLLLPSCTIRSATSCSSQIYPDLRFCKVSGAEYAILTEGRKTEAINHKPLPHFLFYRDRMKQAVNKTTARHLCLRLSPDICGWTCGSPGWKSGKERCQPPSGLAWLRGSAPRCLCASLQNQHLPITSIPPPSCATGRQAMAKLELPGCFHPPLAPLTA